MRSVTWVIISPTKDNPQPCPELRGQYHWGCQVPVEANYVQTCPQSERAWVVRYEDANLQPKANDLTQGCQALGGLLEGVADQRSWGGQPAKTYPTTLSPTLTR